MGGIIGRCHTPGKAPAASALRGAAALYRAQPGASAMRLATATALALSLASLVPAVEGDVRLGYAVRSRSTDFKTDTGTSSDSWDSAYRFQLGAIVQPIPSLGGGWLVGGRFSMDMNEINGADFRTYEAQIQAGYGIPVTPLLRVEILPYLGVGVAELDTKNSGSSSGNIMEMGLEAGGRFVLDGFILGGAAGYGWSTTSQKPDSGKVDITQSGPHILLFVGVEL
jgi:hypothetical protein